MRTQSRALRPAGAALTCLTLLMSTMFLRAAPGGSTNSIQLPPAMALEPSHFDTAAVLEEARRYADGLQPGDSFVAVDGAQAKASNVHGFEIGGRRYFYRILHHVSFDPISRGAFGSFELVGSLDPGTTWELAVYQQADR